ncbi:Crp/Fnr family transcriptional regulator [Halomonas sp. C05BenzN]|uniref:Crp/Fnr family transcriptional regulator n=1 Tax=Halomonas sp. C05BenzN TaxID=3411041 RepID=UPI003B96621D
MLDARSTAHAAERVAVKPPLRRDALQAIRQVPLFAGLEDETLALLTHGALERGYRRGSWLFSEGEPADRFYVVLDGWVKLFRESHDGNECMVGLFTRGESFAEAAMFDRLGFPVNAAVAEDARLLIFPAEHFLTTLQHHHELALNLLANLSGMLRGLIRQLDQLTTQPTYQRLAAFLVTLCPSGAARATVCLPCDKLLIAGRLGMKPESFSRALARLREVGVYSERNCVLIEDVVALKRLASGGEESEGAAPGPRGCAPACQAGKAFGAPSRLV